MASTKTGDDFQKECQKNIQRRKLLSLLSRKEKETLIDYEKMLHHFSNPYIDEFLIDNWDERVSDIILEKIQIAIGE